LPFVAEHKLPKGKAWIENLLALGSALGYVHESEYDVFSREDREGPVDVAWFRSDEDRFPLFIFEVETVASGQMSHNAGKVFAQDTKLFEKPLFLFHLIVDGTKQSARVDVAEEAYGKFNYRIYGVPEGEATAALCDILSQHRRVSDQLDIPALARCLGPWQEVDLDRVWAHAEECHFRGAWLRSYATLALSRPESFLERLVGLLERGFGNERIEDQVGYGTYLGSYCSPAIHAGILAERDPRQGEERLADLVGWQEGDGIMKMAAPYPGLSEEGDNFVFALMPSVWALLAVHFRCTEGARSWILEQMELVAGPESGLGLVAFAATAIWMAHIAAAGDGHEEQFEKIRERLNGEGGISAALLAHPPTVGGLVADFDQWWEQIQTDKEPVPELEEFRANFGGSEGVGSAIPLALRFLLEDTPPEVGGELRDLLAG
jgi:hypothetical protein